MERLDCRRTSTLAKSIGTIVSISGAFVVTLYKGAVLMTRSSSLSFNNHLLLPVKSNWFLGGLLLAADCVLASAWLILQVIGDLSSLALSLCLFFPFSGNRKPFISSEKCLWCWGFIFLLLYPGSSSEKISSGAHHSVHVLLLRGHSICSHIFVRRRRFKCLELKKQDATDFCFVLGKAVTAPTICLIFENCWRITSISCTYLHSSHILDV